MENIPNKKQSWVKKRLLNSIGLANLAAQNEQTNNVKIPKNSLKSNLKKPQIRNNTSPVEENVQDLEPQFGQPVELSSQNYGQVPKEEENNPDEKKKSFKDKTKEKVDEAEDDLKEHAKDEIKREVKEAVKDATKEAAEAASEAVVEAGSAFLAATSEVWLPILLIIIAVIIIVVGLVFYFNSAQSPSPTGTSATQTLDTNQAQDNTIGQQLLAASGNANLTNSDITALLNSAEQEIKKDEASVKPGEKNYTQVQCLGKQGLDLIAKIRSEINTSTTSPAKTAPKISTPAKTSYRLNFHSLIAVANAQAQPAPATNNTSLVRTQLKQLADIINQLNALVGTSTADLGQTALPVKTSDLSGKYDTDVHGLSFIHPGNKTHHSSYATGYDAIDVGLKVAGDPIYAPFDGYATNCFSGRDESVRITKQKQTSSDCHNNSGVTVAMFSHVNTSVATGQQVKVCQIVARVKTVSFTHVHVSLIINGKNFNADRSYHGGEDLWGKMKTTLGNPQPCSS
jgi:hypothetical protein